MTHPAAADFDALHQDAHEGPLATAFSRFIWRHKAFYVVAFVFLGVGCDQATKHWAQDTLAVEKTEARWVKDSKSTTAEHTVVLDETPSTTRMRVHLADDVTTVGDCRTERVPQVSSSRPHGFSVDGNVVTLHGDCVPTAPNADVDVTYPVAGLGVGHVVTVVPDAFNFRYAENRSAAFGLTSSVPPHARRWLLVALSTLAVVVMLTWFFRTRRPDGVLQTALLCVVVGAIGNNLLDRARLGYVVDFIDWRAAFINPAWPPWPTFNVADVFIVVGGVLLMWRSIKPLYDEEVPPTAAAA